MKSQNLERVLDEISDERVPQDLNLLPGIIAEVQRGDQPRMKTAAKLRIAALLLALVLLVACFSLPGVASALKKLIGYIPGVGTVDQSAALRMLASPVTVTSHGYTITVESALLDSAHTVLKYRVSGQFPVWDDPTLKPMMCEEPPVLRLADGRELDYPSREGSSGGGETSWKIIFPAVPAAQDSAVLVLPCLAELPAGDGPQGWEIPLLFAQVPPEMTVFPVVQQPTALPAVPEETASLNDMQVSLQGIASLDDGYFLQAALHWQKDPSIFEVQLFPDSVHLFDSAGQEVSVWPTGQTSLSAPAEDQNLALDLQTGPILSPGPARLVVDYVGVSMSSAASITFDVGQNPQPGQTWELNKDLDINGYSLRVLSAEYVQAPPGEPAWLMLYLSSDSGILTVNAVDTQHEILGTGGSPGSEHVPFRAGWRYKDGFPRGPVTAEISAITVRRSGPWSLTWSPPAAAGTPTAQAAAILPREQGACP